MFATLVIGLREGLEAVLVVGIIALFLRRNGQSLRPMVLGVTLAVLGSLGIALGLQFSARSLPQAQQEGMEAVIGALTVLMVTGMVLWMGRHAGQLKGELEAQARNATQKRSALALSVMAFLAVFKEGVETAFFLLAAFQSTHNAFLASAGALLGLGLAVVVGVLFFKGALRIDLGKFFKISTAFLIVVAGGILLNAFRGAAGAGWIHFGQSPVADLHTALPYGSLRSAIFTGVFGIPTDIRVLDLVVWLSYVLPVTLLCYWPARLRPRSERIRRRALLGAAALLTLAAVITSGAVSASAAETTKNTALTMQPASKDSAALPSRVSLTSAPDLALKFDDGTTLALKAQGETQLGDRTVSYFVAPFPGVGSEGSSAAPSPSSGASTGLSSITLEQLRLANGSRLPVGFTALRTPGPFRIDSSLERESVEAWGIDGELIKASSTPSLLLTLSSGGLTTPKTLSIAPAALASAAHQSGAPNAAPASKSSVAALFTTGWHTDEDQQNAQLAALDTQEQRSADLPLWQFVVPGFLLIWALVALYAGLRGKRE